MPVLQVSDVVRSEAFYARLGFASHGSWGDPPGFCIVQRGDVTLALDRTRDGGVPLNQWWAAYVYVDALHAEFLAEGLDPSDIHRPTEYGCDDFDVIDPDGHRLAFGQARAPHPGPGLADDRGRG